MRFIVYLILILSFDALAQLNTPYDEQSPVLSPNGKELYYTIANHPANTKGSRDAGDIWVAKFIDGKWQAPSHLISPINNEGYNAVLGFSSDGSDMYLYGHYTSTGGEANSQGISVSKKVNDEWTIPKNEVVPSFLNKSISSGGYITPDKKIFIYSAEGRAFDSFGNEDIYVSFNRDGAWTEPLNLGSTINTTAQELSPGISFDGKRLYFSSNKPGGFGGFDIYECERLDDSWINWTNPKNIGDKINSNARELYYIEHTSLDAKTHLYTTTKNSDGYGDVRMIRENIDLRKPEIISRTDTTLILKGKVIDEVTGKGVSAWLSLSMANISLKSNSDSFGTYSLLLRESGLYSIEISAPGYLKISKSLDLKFESNNEVILDFKLRPMEVGVSVNLEHVLFRQSSTELLRTSYDELDEVVNFLKGNPSVVIELSGHTDNGGDAKLNLKLSKERVGKVKSYLVSKGISASRIKGVGYGETKPLYPNDTEESRKLNRRVEFKILRK